MGNNRLIEIQKHGQSIWMDFITRGLMTSGKLQKLVERGIVGMTSNPTIFAKAIGDGDEYDDTIKTLLDLDATTIYEKLAIADIQAAADVLLAVYDRADDICFRDLPGAFVLKVNHGSGQNWIVRDNHREDERRVRRQFREWMAENHYVQSREWPYRGMTPRIVAEELLLDEAGRIPSDYKLHCFNGRAELIQVDVDRDTAHRRNFYDPAWRRLPFVWTEWEGAAPLWPGGREVDRPDALPEMIRLAETLSKDFPYARIDLFFCRGRVYFGEITFFHGGGFERMDPPEWDRKLGDRLALPSAAT